MPSAGTDGRAAMPAVILGSFRVEADHPSLPGHFPGRPVVPGVVLLDHVLRLLRDGPGWRVLALPMVRFVAPVLPGETVEVSAGVAHAGRLGFAATQEGRPVLRGTALVAPGPSPPPVEP